MGRPFKIWAALFLIGAVLIYYLEGVPVNPFALWNAVPLLLGYFLMYISVKRNSKPLLIGFSAYTTLGIGLLFFMHFAWYFDWGKTQSGSSTSGIIFIFLPPASMIVGGVAWFAGWLLGKSIYRKKET